MVTDSLITTASPHLRPLPEIVIVHGGWQDSWWWRPVAADLAEYGFRCRTPDLPGCAANDPDAATVTLHEMADTVLGAIQAIPPSRDIVLVAHSGGGLVGQLVAAAVPHRICAMVFVSAFALAGGQGEECIADLLPSTQAPMVDLARRGEPIPMDPGAWFEEFAQDATVDARTEAGPRVAATRLPPACLTAAPDWRPFWELLAAQAFPVRYVFMEQDRAIPTELLWQMAQRLRPATTGWTPGSHQGFHRHHAEFVDTLLATTTTGLTTGPRPAHMS